MQSGIYIIKSLIDKRVYIGKSINVPYRLRKHKEALVSKRHVNSHLQSFVNKYGINKLSFKILKYCQENELLNLEKKYIKKFNSRKIGFNQTDGGDDNHKRKPYLLQNMITGQIERGERIKDFAVKYGFSTSGVSSVVSGRKKYIYNWYNPEKWTPREYILIGPDNKEYKVIETKIAQFCREQNLRQYCGTIAYLLNGKRESVFGWKRPNSILNKEILTQTKLFKAISPKGELVIGQNVSKFCRENNLTQSNFNNMLLGKKKSCQGWKPCYEIN
jgi:predicted GIY-YIG superfamily endonuclease